MIASIKKNLRVYSAVHDVKHPPELKFIDASGLTFNTIHPNDYRFFEELSRLIRNESFNSSWDMQWLDQLKDIGIEKTLEGPESKPFTPDGRMKTILSEAAAVGNAIARTIAFRNRNQDIYLYPGKSWRDPDAKWEEPEWGVDARVRNFYLTTGQSHGAIPSRSAFAIDSQRILTSFDADKNYFDGAKSYKLHLPPQLPAKTSWSVILYDTQTRSELQTDQQFPSTGSRNPALKANEDGSYDLFFSPTAPPGQENNWVQTMPGKSWFVILRVNDPLESWFKKTWQPDDVTLIKNR